MKKMKKLLLVAIVGVVLVFAGGLLCLNAKSLSMRSMGSSPMTFSSGEQVGAITFSQEDTSRSGALVTISVVMLSVGGVLLVLTAAAWLHAPKTESKHETLAA